METTLLSSKGQVIIPKLIRESHHWQSGTRFVVEETPVGILLKPMNIFPPTNLKAGLGCTGYRGPAKNLDEMNKVVDEELRREWQKVESP